MEISLIWAMAENGVIGRDATLPWRLPMDMQFFMTATMGKPVIMGRRTFESMKAPLPGRTNIVITRDPDYSRTGIKVAANFAEALKIARAQCVVDGTDEIMIAGGADIYRLGLAVATRLYVTRVHADVEGDTYFPEVDFSLFEEARTESFPADEHHEYPFSISVYNRRR
ncbi:MAG: dihydrofolate reductase [Pseudomonadales bacterium]|jgi:dihydrofolate reductase